MVVSGSISQRIVPVFCRALCSCFVVSLWSKADQGGGGAPPTTLALAGGGMDHEPWTNLQVRTRPGGLQVDKSGSQGLAPWYHHILRVLNTFPALVSPGSKVLGGIGAENLKTPNPGHLEIG